VIFVLGVEIVAGIYVDIVVLVPIVAQVEMTIIFHQLAQKKKKIHQMIVA
jgi:hypothetical protein